MKWRGRLLAAWLAIVMCLASIPYSMYERKQTEDEQSVTEVVAETEGETESGASEEAAESETENETESNTENVAEAATSEEGTSEGENESSSESVSEETSSTTETDDSSETGTEAGSTTEDETESTTTEADSSTDSTTEEGISVASDEGTENSTTNSESNTETNSITEYESNSNEETTEETEEETEEETTEATTGMTSFSLGASAYDITITDDDLQDAIDTLETNSVTDTVTITLDCDCTDDITIYSDLDIILDLNGYTLTAEGTSKSGITVYGKLTLQDSSSGGTGTVQGGASTNQRGVTVSKNATFTMTGGTVTGFAVTGSGGGVSVEKSATFNFTGGEISGNTATIYGGGVLLYETGQLATITGGTISGNEAKGSGGGLAVNNATNSEMTLPAGLIISGNTAAKYGGGVYFNSALDTLTISSNISGNTATEGPGGGVYFGATVSTLIIKDATINENISGAAGGGAYFAVKVPSATISGSSISYNKAEGNGGGIYFLAGTSLVLENSDDNTSKINKNKITGEGAMYGGGIYLPSSSGAMSTFVSTGGEISYNTITSTNSTNSYGGGLYMGRYSSITMENTAVCGNTSIGYGGGVAVESDTIKAEFTDCTFSGNYANASSANNSGVGGAMWINNNIYNTSTECCGVYIHGGTYSDNYAGYQGGAIYVPRSLTLDGAVKVSGNTSYDVGGGLRSETLVLIGGDSESEAIEISGNTSQTSYGGGAYASCTTGGYAITATGWIKVYGNEATISSGGGLAVNGGGMYLSGNIEIYDNTASSGGGLYSYSSSEYKIVLEGDVEIYKNTVSSSGGGICAQYVIEMSDGVSIHDNYAGNYGGAVITKCILMTGGEIYGNSATNGGAIYINAGLVDTSYSSDGLSHISGGKIYDNEARTGVGGAVDVVYSSSAANGLSIDGNVEIYGNSAYTNGGAIWTGDALDITGGEIHDNTAVQRGGGVYVAGYQGQTVNIEIASGYTGVIYDNQAGYVNGGNDVALYYSSNTIYGSSGNNQLNIDDASTFFTSDKSITGTYWYNETAGENVSDEINVYSTSTSNVYYYTFIYESSKTQVAKVWKTSGEYQIFSSVQAAVDAIASATSGTYGNYDGTTDSIQIIMIDDSREDVDITANLSVTLDLDGHTLKALTNSAITVEADANLTITDSSEEKSGKITGGSGTAGTIINSTSTNTYGGGLLVYGDATLEGGTITGNNAIYGAGVFVASGGTFTMTGGSITENGYTSTYGGGVYVYGTNYNANNSEAFTMEGGSITGNTANSGGGIYTSSVNIKITGGSITENTATNNGGGICTVNSAILTMTGGEITKNTTTNTTSYGGGIYMNNGGNTLNVSGTAKIYDNTTGSKIGNDIRMLLSSGTLSLLDASSASGGIYDSWYDAGNPSNGTKYSLDYYTSSINLSGGIGGSYYFLLTATKYPSEYVAYIPNVSGDTIYQYDTETEDEEGNTVYAYTTDVSDLTDGASSASATSNGTAYTTLQAAINAAGETETIYLLCDHTEDVTLTGQTATIDLNGYTLYTEDAYGFKLTQGSSKSTTLTIKDTSKDDTVVDRDAFHNTISGAVGTLTPDPDNTAEFPRAIYSTANESYKTTIVIDGVYIHDYGNEKTTDPSYSTSMSSYYGGAIYTGAYHTVTIKGYSMLSDNVGYSGGALYMSGYSLNLTIDDDVEISGNKAYQCGGIYVDETDNVNYTGSVSIGKATFKNNEAVNYGAIYINGINHADSTSAAEMFPVKLEGTIIEGNTATTSYGGISILYVANVMVTDCSITNNYAGNQYGGMYIASGDKIAENARINIEGTNIENNTAGKSYAGLAAVSYGVLTMSGCYFYGNTSQSGSSALYIQYVADGSTVTETEITGNVTSGGYAFSMQSSAISLEKLTATNNTTSASCGAVYLANSNNDYDMKATFDDCNISNNSNYGLHLNLNNILGNVSEATVTNTTITGNGNYGIYSCINGTSYSGSDLPENYYRTYRNNLILNIGTGTKIYENKNSGVCSVYGTVNMSDGSIYSNTATYGGGIYSSCSNFNISGGEIYNNTATYGGGIYMVETETTYSGKLSAYRKACTITGGSIYGNTATIASNNTGGGGIFIGNYSTLTMTGGTVTDNTTNSYGGGIFISNNYSVFTLDKDDAESTVGRVYGNTAVLGQDVYAYSATNYNTDLVMLSASDMMDGLTGYSGIGWLNESTSIVTSTSINYTSMTKSYPLTLEYETNNIVAVIWDAKMGIDGGYQVFASVQDAVDALYNENNGSITTTGYYDGTSNPEIILIDDAVGNVEIPGGITATINLNGYTLKGTTTAITCYGTLDIKDVQYEEDAVSGDYYCEHYTELLQAVNDNVDASATTVGNYGSTGTITGTSATVGGGIYLCSGAVVTMTSGQISNCSAGGTSSGATYGGAGVYVESSTFTLGGTAKITNCSTKSYGAAVYVGTVSGTFILQDDAEISDNTTNYGAVYVLNGTFKMTGGTITGNTATSYGGGVYISGGTSHRISGGTITGNTAATRGGGIYLANGTLTLSGKAQVTENTVTAAITTSNYATGAGGGIYSSGTLNIGTGVKITDNEAARGGGIFQSGGTITMSGGQITDNTAEYGGGIAQNPASSSGTFTLSGGVLCNNTSNYDVGNDVYNTYDDGTSSAGITAILISANDMEEDGYTNPYNVWKDDSYTGTETTGEYVGSGMYVTGRVPANNALQLTATLYGKKVETVKAESDAYVSEITMTGDGIVDGTGSWDTSYPVTSYKQVNSGNTTWSATTDVDKNPVVETWTAGYDADAKNGLVRSYDTITYNCNVAVDGSNVSEGSDNTVTLYVEVALPLTSDKAEIVNGSGLTNTITSVSDDGKTQYLTGYMTVDEKTANHTFSIKINVKGMTNGSIVKPTFSSWIDENEDDADNPKTLTPTEITVSATGRYNVTLLSNSTLGYTGYFNLETGEETTAKAYAECDDGSIVYGTMVGYGITLSLWNSATKNGMKGVEVPDGNITFSLTLTSTITDTSSGDMETVAPYIWAYKANEKTDTGTSLSGNRSTNMNWNDSDDLVGGSQYAYDAAPFNSRGVSSTDGKCTCYSGGAWSASGTNPTGTATSTTITFTVSGYEIDPTQLTSNPNYMSDTSTLYNDFNNTYTRAFSAGYVQVILPVTDTFAASASTYVTSTAEGMVSGLSIKSASGEIQYEDTSNPDDDDESAVISTISTWGLTATNEMKYGDNYNKSEWGLYVTSGSGGDTLTKTNYFKDGNNSSYLPSSYKTKGTGSTPLGSTVYIGSEVTYSSTAIDPTFNNTIDPNNLESTSNEYNYLTSLDILQKFDANAYTPLCTEKVIEQEYAGSSATNTIDGGNFIITTSETTTDWGSAYINRTRSYTLTILYAAKPDGSNWTYSDVTLDGVTYKSKTTEMDETTEDELIYFESLDELYAYFGTYDSDGNPTSYCVGILYEFRDCCIRGGRYIDVRAKMSVTNDFEAVGETYCTTNDVLGWTTYRPTYKICMTAGSLDEILYGFSWHDVTYDTGNGMTAYGFGDGATTKSTAYTTAKEIYDAAYTSYAESKTNYYDYDYNDYSYTGAARLTNYYNGYIKTEYSGGVQVSGTHVPGYYSGSTLLIYTMESGISIEVADLEEKGGTTKKSTYNLSSGEWTANFTVTPTLSLDTSVSNEAVLKGEVPLTVQITITLPKNLNYNEGSLEFDYTGSGYEEGDLNWDVDVSTDSDGVTTIVITTQVTNVNKILPTIDYSTTIADPGDSASITEVLNQGTLTSTAELYLAYDDNGTERLATDTKTDTVPIKVTGSSKQYIWVTGSGKQELGTDLVFSLHYENAENTNPESVEIGTILPYNGDYRGSVFGGGYQVTEITLTFEDVDSYEAYLGSSSWTSGTETVGKIYYVADGLTYTVGSNNIPTTSGLADLMTELTNTDSTAGGNAKELENAKTPTSYGETTVNGSTVWQITYTLTTAESEALTQYSSETSGIGLYVYLPSVASKKDVTIDITMKTATTDSGGITTGITDSSFTDTPEQEGGNVYYENMFYRIYTDNTTKNTALVSNSAYISIVERLLSGVAWLDRDGDGIYSTTDDSINKPMENVDVYLYTETCGYTDAQKTAAENDGEDMSTITLEGVVDGTSSLKTLYRAVDVYGNILGSVVTSESGLYTFEKLASGTYYVVFKDDIDATSGKEEYTIINDEGVKETPVSFSQLGVTSTAYITTSGDYNKSEPDYEENNGTTELSYSYIIYDTVSTTANVTSPVVGISLPAVEEISQSKFVAATLNSGYTTASLTIEKTWENIFDLSDISEYDAVSFEVVGTIDDGVSGTTTVSDTIYTMTRTDDASLTSTVDTIDNMEVSGTTTVYDNPADRTNSTTTTTNDAFTVTAKASEDANTGTMTVTWSTTITLPPQTADEEDITYSFYTENTGTNISEEDGISETSGYGGTTSGITGFKISSASFTDDGYGAYTYTATNTQIAYAIDVYKISSELDEGNACYLSGAEFTLYDDTLQNALFTVTSGGTDSSEIETGTIMLGYLEPGTYYLKETNAPDGYNLNLGVWKITIELSGGVSSFSIELINDQTTGESLTGANVITYTDVATGTGSLTAGSAAEEYIVTGYTAAGALTTDTDETTLYTVAFEIANTPGAELPESGSFGTIWFRLAGLLLILAAASMLLIQNKRRRA